MPNPVCVLNERRAMGLYAAKCMTDSVDELGSGGAFDLFVHATQFFGHKVNTLHICAARVDGVVHEHNKHIQTSELQLLIAVYATSLK